MHKISMTHVLIILCVAIFLLRYAFSADVYSLYALFYWESANANVAQYVTHLFFHGGLLHLSFNLFALWMFGSIVERLLGTKKFIGFYFACGIGAAIVYQLVTYYQFQQALMPLLNAGILREDIISVFNSQQYYSQFPTAKQAINLFASPVVGASGAIYGVLVAFAYLRPNYKLIFIFLPLPIAAKFFVPIILLLDIFSSITGVPIFGQNIAYAAHIGGAITGFILMLWLGRSITTDSQSTTLSRENND